MSGEESEQEFEGPIASANQIPNWLFWGTILVVLVLIVGLVYPSIHSTGGRGGYEAKAVQNLKQVGYALFNFESDFGSYPNEETAKELLAEDGELLLSSAGGSNYYFSQLISAGYVDQEAPFHAKTTYSHEPDNVKSTADELLAKGEVGFAYVLWDKPEGDDEWLGIEPLAIAFLNQYQTSAETDSSGDVVRSRVYVLRRDMSVVDLKTDKNGKVLRRSGDYFDWSQPHWRGQKPRIVWPE